MNEEKQDPKTHRKQLTKLFSKLATLSDKDKELLAELVRGAEACFANAEQLFQEASLLREHRHFSRSIFLHQIAMEECAKVDMIGAAATALMWGHPVDFDSLEKDFRDHRAKNFSNAYMAKVSEAEMAARAANDGKAATRAFESWQREIHGFLNTTKNASMYVDFKDGKFVAPDDAVTEELALQIAAVSYYFMSVTYPRLRPLRRMLEEPDLHSELMARLGEVIQKALAEGTIEARDAAFSRYLKEMAAQIVAADNKDPKTPDQQ